MSLVLGPTSPNDPQRERSLKPPDKGSAMGLIGARWVPFTSKTRPNQYSRFARPFLFTRSLRLSTPFELWRSPLRPPARPAPSAGNYSVVDQMSATRPSPTSQNE